MLLPMSIVMFEMIALVLERIEGFILNLPAAAPSTHDSCHGTCEQCQIGDPGPSFDFAIGRGLLVKQKVDLEIGRAIIQPQTADPGVVMLHALVIRLTELLDLASRLTRSKLLKEAFMRVGFDVQDIAPAVARDLSQVRRIGE